MSVSRLTKRPLAWVFALATAMAVLVAVPPSSSAGPTAARQPSVPTLDWQPCDDGFDCATAEVPLDYDHPHARQISLSLVRLPALNPSRRIGSLFLNPGGPGASGVDFVREAGPFLFSKKVRTRFDLVGFDPRGVMRSNPLLCFDNLDDAFEVYTPFAFPVTKAEEKLWAASDRKVAGACAKRRTPILDHMSTADAARDVDLLRRAVHDDKLTYAGYSYGSFLGATYANLFPGKVRAVVVDGVLDPVAWATGRKGQARTKPFSTRLRSDTGAMATLRQMLKLCDRGGTNCAFSQGNPQRRFDRLAQRLLDEPAQIPDGEGGTFPFLYSDLIAQTLGALYDPGSWPFLAEFLEELDQLRTPARSTRGVQAATSLRALRERLGLAQELYPNFVEGFPGVACPETDNPAHVADWSRAAASSDRNYGYFGRIWTWVSSVCQPWPGHAADRYDGPFTHRTANPVLVVGNYFDPATRYHGAVTLSRLLPNSRLLTLHGWGHTSLFASSCIDGYVNRYLLTGRASPRGKVCSADVVPFAQPTPTLARRTAASTSILIPAALRRMLER